MMFKIFGTSRRKPNEVFTPRAATVNEAMYIQRPRHEHAIIQLIRTGFHIIIHGESGTGKTWLYKSTLARAGIPFSTINMANAARFGDLNRAFEEYVRSIERESRGVRTVETTGKIDLFTASAERNSSQEYVPNDPEPFERCLRALSSKNVGRKVLVFDNFESIIINTSIVAQVVNVLTLLDDETYSKYETCIAIVGVPGDIRDLFSKIHHSQTIENRVKEVPEVSRLSPEQVSDLVTRGFEKELQFTFESGFREEFLREIAWLTDRVPQHVHELCLSVAYAAEQDKTVSRDKLQSARESWISESLTSNYTVISKMMNSRETGIGRRNQTLYALGLYDGEDFRYSDIEEIVRKEFPADTDGVTLNIPQIFARLSSGENPIITRVPGGGYRFVNPKYRMCLRAMLKKSERGGVEKLDLSHMQS
jgi:hypothetical protein